LFNVTLALNIDETFKQERKLNNAYRIICCSFFENVEIRKTIKTQKGVFFLQKKILADSLHDILNKSGMRAFV
jgi:hypothetical protein